jgi:hypothetical protein
MYVRLALNEEIEKFFRKHAEIKSAEQRLDENDHASAFSDDDITSWTSL